MTTLESNYLSSFIDRGTCLTCFLSNEQNIENTEFKRLPNLKLNFLQELDPLMKQIARSVRLSPEEPTYGISKLEICINNNYVEVTSNLLKEFLTTKLFDFQTSMDKFHVKAYLLCDNIIAAEAYRSQPRNSSRARPSKLLSEDVDGTPMRSKSLVCPINSPTESLQILKTVNRPTTSTSRVRPTSTSKPRAETIKEVSKATIHNSPTDAKVLIRPVRNEMSPLCKPRHESANKVRNTPAKANEQTPQSVRNNMSPFSKFRSESASRARLLLGAVSANEESTNAASVSSRSNRNIISPFSKARLDKADNAKPSVVASSISDEAKVAPRPPRSVNTSPFSKARPPTSSGVSNSMKPPTAPVKEEAMKIPAPESLNNKLLPMSMNSLRARSTNRLRPKADEEAQAATNKQALQPTTTGQRHPSASKSRSNSASKSRSMPSSYTTAAALQSSVSDSASVETNNENRKPENASASEADKQDLNSKQSGVALTKMKVFTSGEVTASFPNSLRGGIASSASSASTSTVTNKQSATTASAAAVTSNSTSEKSKKHVVEIDALFKSMGIDLEEAFGGSSKSSKGRPSIGTVIKQWHFMRTNYVQGDDKELDWLMKAKQDGAYKYAHKKFGDAEDQYFKALCEIDRYSNQTKVLSSTDSKAFIHAIEQIANMDTSSSEAAAIDNDNTEAPLDEQKQLEAIESLKALCRQCLSNTSSTKSQSIFKLLSKGLQEQISRFLNINEGNTNQQQTQTVAGASPSLAPLTRSPPPRSHSEAGSKAIIKLATTIKTALLNEISKFHSHLKASVKQSEIHLKDIELWSSREQETADYQECMEKKESDFITNESANNIKALEIMRSYLPTNIFDLTLQQFRSIVLNERSGYYPDELLHELKKNKFLHWIMMHPDDITTTNFLNGSSKQYFENLDQYDIVEMRALSLCIPRKFDVDMDGRKAEWRIRFFTKLQLLISQEKGEFVKGGWNAKEQRRDMVKLASLKPEQQRRSIYFYRTKKQYQHRLAQYDDKEKLLYKKEILLQQLIQQEEDAKDDFDSLITELRQNPGLKEQYGPEKVTKIKAEGKEEWRAIEIKRKEVQEEVLRLKKTITEYPISREQYIVNMEALKAFLSLKGHDWDTAEDTAAATPAAGSISVSGVFESNPVITKSVKITTKFVSAEEEALQRKKELTDLKANSTKTQSYTPNVDSLVESTILPAAAATSSSVSAQVSLDIDADADSYQVDHRSSNSSSNSSSMKTITSSAESSSKENALPSTSANTAAGSGSVLLNANQNVLNCLNKILTESQQSAFTDSNHSTASNASSAHASTKPNYVSTAAIAAVAAAVVVTADVVVKDFYSPTTTKVQSKLLQKLAEKESTEVNHRPTAVASSAAIKSMSFLDELKAKKKELCANN